MRLFQKLARKQSWGNDGHSRTLTINLLRQALAGQIESNGILKILRDTFEEPLNKNGCSFGPSRDAISNEKFTLEDETDDNYPYISAAGFTYSYKIATIAYDGGRSRPFINLDNVEEFYHKEGEAVYFVPNDDLVNFFSNIPKFVNTFISVARILLSYKHKRVLTSYPHADLPIETCTRGHDSIELPMVVFLLASGVPWQSFSSWDIYHALCKICEMEKIPIPLSLVLEKAINSFDREGKTPLMWAIALENKAFCAENLILCGANVEAIDNQGKCVYDQLVHKVKGGGRPFLEGFIDKIFKSKTN